MITFAFDLSNIGTLLLFVLIIGVLISWHELGHLLAAKKFNVYCYEYSIGFGPAIYKNKKKETHFYLRAIPLGGFVKMAGEEGVEDGVEIKGNNGEVIPADRILGNKSVGKRALVLAAGGLMNLLLALVCFYFYVSFNNISAYTGKENSTGFVQHLSTNEVYIDEDGLLGKTFNMQTGDKVIKVETKYQESDSYMSFEINDYLDIQEALDSKRPNETNKVQDIKITYLDVSENSVEKVITTSREYKVSVDENGKETASISLIGLGQNFKAYEYNALTGLYGAWHFMGYYTVEVAKSFGQLFMGKFENLSGLVGIYTTIDTVATEGTISFGARVLNIVYITGAISFSLGFFNLIPFPALDGGRLVFVALEAIRRKKINPNVEATIHFVGIIILFALMIIINIKDIINLAGVLSWMLA